MDIRIRFDVDDEAVSQLHAAAFASSYRLIPWQERLSRHSVTWVGAFSAEELVGFVHAVWDGGAHAFLLDTIVAPDRQRTGIGRTLVQTLTRQTKLHGCQWLHVDFEPSLAGFYSSCGFTPTEAGLLSLTQPL
ncbi:GNAT family N-acetyltransferase [Arthrobacter sp. H14]|uniref:GNAT family N-acetyltransferase n=1 Tax=Arthrobacter sp. H14 TaxID=1312959 RepID=UPI00047A7A32|nr:GNAT family N-acetyltransferase [Arthrobacter sp. H14]